MNKLFPRPEPTAHRCGTRGAGLSMSADEPEPNDRCDVLYLSINDKKGTPT